MFLNLFKRYLKSFENPWTKALTSTFLSFLLCVVPFLLLLLGEWILHLINGWLLFPTFKCDLFDGFLRMVKWLIENLTVLAIPLLFLLFGGVILYLYMKRSSISVMISVYIFKRMTEPLLGANFAAWIVSILIGYRPLSFLDHLIDDKNLQTFGSGQMVIVMLGMWLILTLALHIQISKIREENSAVGLLAIWESARLQLLGWVERRQSIRSAALKKPDKISK